jgi:hypothetical protein
MRNKIALGRRKFFRRGSLAKAKEFRGRETEKNGAACREKCATGGFGRRSGWR